MVTSATTKKTAAEEHEAIVKEWEKKAKADAQAAASDLTRAQTLLEDLTKEIAPIAQAEFTLR